MWLLTFLLSVYPVHATASAKADGACDARAIEKELADASPAARGKLFLSLADCDAEAAKAVAPDVMPTILSGDDGYAAAVVVIEVGAPDVAAKWIETLQSDERAAAIGVLGKACNDSKAVQSFFVSQAQAMGADFWEQRWYSALAECHVASVQEVLWSLLDKGLGSERSLYFAVLHTYARSAGKNAVPRLKTLAQKMASEKEPDEEAITNVVAAFGDAAGIGSLAGLDPDAAKAADQAIVALEPLLPVKAIEQARITLTALGDPEAADKLVAVRYKNRVHDGQLLWGTVAVETATCKNGKVKRRVHVAQVTDPGQTWPDQLEDKVTASIKVGWELDLAQRCKGTEDLKVIVPPEPFADSTAFKTWAEGQVKRFQNDGKVKRTPRVDHDPIKL